MITLYQISAKHLKTDLENKAYNQALLFGFPGKGLLMCLYRKVAVINTDDMEEAFMLANTGDSEKIEWKSLNMRSMSVGDVISNSNGKFYVCQDKGFRKIKCHFKSDENNYKKFLTLSDPWAEIVYETSRKTGFKTNRLKRNIKTIFNVQKLKLRSKIRRKLWNY
jgi:hypothetical protein